MGEIHFRNLAVSLPVTELAFPVRQASMTSKTLPDVKGGKSSFVFTFPGKQDYGLEIFDIWGRRIQSLSGVGPVLRRQLRLPTSGVFFVKFQSGVNTYSRKVVAF